MKRTNTIRWMLAAVVAAAMSLTMNAQQEDGLVPPLPPVSDGEENSVHSGFKHNSPLSGFDLNEDGDLTAAEFSAAGEAMALDRQADVLNRYDSVPDGEDAGDGIITAEESNSVHQARAEAWLARVLETLDTNGDGAISEADNLPRRGRRGPRRLSDLDANEDGAVSGDELVAAAERMAASLHERFVARFDSVPDGADAGDGIITAEEILAVHENHILRMIEAALDRYDLNKDGDVTSEEIAQADAMQNRGRRGPPRGGDRL